jgi:hypothetical protein
MPIPTTMCNQSQMGTMKLKNYLYHLSGSDYRMVDSCSRRLRRCFLLLGIAVLLFTLLSGLSSYLAFLQILGNERGGLLLAIFFAWMLSNMYRLLLYAAAKDPLPQSKGRANAGPTWVLRVLFACFLALLISKPLECLLYKRALDTDVLIYKTKAAMENRQQIDAYYRLQIAEVEQLNIDPAYRRQFIRSKETACRQAMEEAGALLNSSGFYIQRLRFLNNRHPSCWYITSALILLFLFPLILRRWLRDCAYEGHHELAARRIVRLNYCAFHKKYLALFLRNHQRHVSCNDNSADPPYNTLEKQDLTLFHTEQKLISEFYHA